MHLSGIKIKDHPILGNINIPFLNEKTGIPYPVIVFVGENGCGKTTMLNELFNYSNSNYVINKQVSVSFAGEKEFCSIFVRQDSRYSEAMNELTAKISGRADPFPMKSKVEFSGGQNVLNLRSNNGINDPAKGKDLLSLFNDPTILEAYESKKISEIKCGGEVLTSIDGSKSSIDLTQLSSGQQEILLKIKAVEQTTSGTDLVLFDEPETSLHPRWQKIIVNFVKDMIRDESGNSPQLFIATHSEKVMESLIGNDDVLIVRLSKEGKKIKSERINEMDLYLPRVTFAELDYVVFGIPSYEYHDQLLTAYGEMIGTDNVSTIDTKIKHSKLWTPDYFKKWTVIIHTKNNGDVEKNYKTLPVYIRNYFHHPKEGKEPTTDELIKSIDFLRKLLKANSWYNCCASGYLLV